jgi:putative FmdB family regulatory protein
VLKGDLLCEISANFAVKGFKHLLLTIPRVDEIITALVVLSGGRIPLDYFGRRSMPVYDYACSDCHKTFERVLTLREHDGQIKCPHCGGRNVVQEAAAFYAVTSKKSA